MAPKTDMIDVLRQQQEARIAGGERLIGTMLYWHPGQAHISRDDFVAKAKVHNIDEDYLPADFDATTPFKRAWRSISAGLPKPPKTPNVQRLELVSESQHEVILALTEGTPDQAGKDFFPDKLGIITFSAATKSISGTFAAGSPGDDVVQKLRDSYQHHCWCTGTDITHTISEWCKDHGVLLKAGTYFIAPQHGAELDNLIALVADASKYEMVPLCLTEYAANRANIQQQTQRGLMEEIRQLSDEISKIDFAKARESTLEKKLELLETKRQRAALFAKVLDFQADDLRKDIDKLDAKIRGELAGKIAEKDGAPSPLLPKAAGPTDGERATSTPPPFADAATTMTIPFTTATVPPAAPAVEPVVEPAKVVPPPWNPSGNAEF